MVDFASPRPPAPALPADRLEAVLGICRRARPAPGGPQARELNRLLRAAMEAAGPGAAARAREALGDVDWLEVAGGVDASEIDADAARDPCADLRSLAPAAERAEDERRLVEKLAASRELRPGLLLRALREGRAHLFHAALAALGGFDREELERAVTAEPEHLACALRAVGVDRSIYPTVVEHLRALGDGRPRERRGSAEAVAAAFRLSAGEAAARARAAGAPA